MENQEEKKPQPVKHPEEANTGEETEKDQTNDLQQPKSAGNAPHVETPRVPNAGAEGHP